MNGIDFANHTLARSLMLHYHRCDPIMVGLLVHNQGLSDREVMQVRGRLRPLQTLRPERHRIMLDDAGPPDADYSRLFVAWFRGA